MTSILILVAAALAPLSMGAAACDRGDGFQHPVSGEIYSPFGYRRHPLLKTMRLHSGLDYRERVGAPVVAAESGTVVAANFEGGYGKYVRIDHGNGMQTSYAHLLKIDVKLGQCVSKGETIGSVGQTGLSSEPHLHFEILRDNRFVDPAALLPVRS